MNLRAVLWGKKTYLIAAGIVVLAGLEATGYVSSETARLIDYALLGGGLAALRAGVAKR